MTDAHCRSNPARTRAADFNAIRRELDHELRWRRRLCGVVTLGRHVYRHTWRVDLGPVGFVESEKTLRGSLRQCRICGECELVPRA